jgi:putative transposase
VPVGCHFDTEAKRLRVMQVRLVKLVLHRPLEGQQKTATISRRRTGKWYVCFSCECAEPSALPAAGAVVGIDVGLKTIATLSTGQEVANPRFFRQEEHARPECNGRTANLPRARLSAPRIAGWSPTCLSARDGAA